MTHNADSAREYIEQKRIMPLVQAISTAIAYSKPDNVVEFMKNLLTDLKSARDSNRPILICFTEANIKAMFSVLDPFDKGVVSRAQMEGALQNFGVDPELFETVIGNQNGPFAIDAFTQLIHDGLKQTLFPQ
jgi:hypothetical protein